MGCLLPLLCGSHWVLDQPLYHWFPAPHPPLPGENLFELLSFNLAELIFAQGSTLLSEGISSGRHPAYQQYKKEVPRCLLLLKLL